MRKALALVLALILTLSLGVTAFAVNNPFVDVKESDWFYADVMKVYEAGYMSGTDSTHFSPNESLTRAMIVTILWRVEGSPEGYTCNFSDVKTGTWYYKGVAWAQSTGIVSGVGDGKYAPNQTLTREQMATIVYRYAQKKLNAQKTDFDFSAYSDANTISSYAKEGVSWLMAQGALHCENNKIQPKEPAKRAEVAAGAALFIKGADPQPGPSDGKSAYEIAVENGFEGTVEEWLESLVGEDGKSAYEIAVASGYTGTEEEWLASLVGATGEAGQDGADGKSAYDLAVENGYTGTVQEWLASLAGDGKNGADGKSAYEIAVANGYVGTEVEWLRSLAGKDGKSAYEIAVDHGYTGTEVEWLASLVGEAGAAGNNGQSAYELAVANGYTGTETEWLATLVGPSGANGKNGTNGKDGANGKSAYELAVELGYTGDLASWLDSLRGTNGKDGKDGANGASAYELAVANGYTGTLTEWLASLVGAPGKDGTNGKNGTNGKDGANGKSAYELAVENGYTGTQQEWLASLVGAPGKDGANGKNGKDGKDGTNGTNGADGKSAYEIAVENGYTGTEAEWLASLAGKDGKDGKDGTNGTNGTNGKDGKDGKDGADGVSVVDAYVNDQVHLILVLSNGTEIDAGYVGVSTGSTPATTYTVTFKDYDGTVLKTQTVEAGGSATPPADPVRDGYTFAGWSGSYTNVQSNVTVTATYTQNPAPLTHYTVTFKDYDGTVLKTQQVEEGGNATPPANPTREGYTFTGWSGSYTNVHSNVTVTAQYRLNSSASYTVTFYDYNGTTVLATRTGVPAGGNAALPAEPTRNGYVFAGWDGVYTNVQANQTVKAKYVKDTEANIIKATSISGKNGNTVTVTLEITGKNILFGGCDLILAFDENVLTFTSKVDGATASTNYVPGQGLLVSVMSTSGVNMTNAQVFVTVTFTVKANAPARSAVNVILDSIFDENDADVPYTIINGEVVVAE